MADDIEEQEDDSFELDTEQKKKTKKELNLWATAFILALTGVLEDNVPELVAEGSDWGGGGLTTKEMAAAAAGILKDQAEYADGFLEDIQARIDEVLAGTYKTQEDFVDGVMDMFEWAKSRAESYAVGAGIPAWREAAIGAMKGNGVDGGVWICTFGPGSCQDCQDLHGEFLTIKEFEQTFGTTECNGGCLCGFVPTNDPDEISDEDLQTVDETADEDGDMTEAA